MTKLSSAVWCLPKMQTMPFSIAGSALVFHVKRNRVKGIEKGVSVEGDGVSRNNRHEHTLL